MKKILFASLLFFTMRSNGQLLVHLNLPPQGIVEKSQLWPITLVNTGNTTLTVHIDLMMSDAISGTPVMNASTKSITVNPGTTQINNASLQPIQYNVLGVGYNVDASPNGLLPLGDFEACYSFMVDQTEGVAKLVEECTELVIEPLGPPQLTMPYDQAVIETKYPQLSWLPPMPSNLFTNLNYDLDLVEILPSQSQEDAIQQNLPLFHQTSIPGTMIQYPISAPALELNKQYAWRIIAKTNEVYVGKSETWVFSIKEFQNVDSLTATAFPFVELKREDETSYAVFSNEIKFDYLNEYEDSTWNIAVYDLSTTQRGMITLNMDSIPLKPGQNLVTYNMGNTSQFVDKHLYLLEVINSRKESLRLRFEYKKPEE